MISTNDTCVTLLDGETLRILITALTGLCGTLIGGLINYFMTKGQMKKELVLEEKKYYHEYRMKEDAEKKVVLEEKKKIYKEYIDVAIKYAAKRDNLEELRKKTIEVVLIGSGKVSKTVSEYYSDINDELNREPELALVKHDEHINRIINAIRKDIMEGPDEIYVHLVDNDKFY